MGSARSRVRLTTPPAARRGFVTLITLLVLVMVCTSPALARRPHGSSGQPDNDTYIPPRTAAQAAFERVKLHMAAGVRLFAAGAVGRTVQTDPAAPDMLCISDCGGGGDDGSGGGSSGGTGGTTGTTGPAPTVILEVRARRQAESFWCGPASGQVVINYSRGFVFSNLGGQSTTTNWKTQSTIAGWMKTTESAGTLGGNLAAALNRPDAVQKPIPEWSYLYATNIDGADMHSKVVTDLGSFSMPLIIAVKPHSADAEYFLPSWPRELPGGKHWITIYGYEGLWDGTDDPQIYYTESAGNGSQGPGSYHVGALTMWKVNQYNAKTIVW